MDKYGICLQALIPVRSHPSERAEMTTQIIFGETYTIDEISGNWARITTIYDNYEGWIDKKLIYNIDNELFNQIKLDKVAISNKIISPLRNITKNQLLPLVAGSSLPSINKSGEFKIQDQKFHYKYKTKVMEPTGENIANMAKQYENAPYLWGGRTVLGIDCSGLTQIVYKIIGIYLNRDASMQVNQGKSVDFIEESQPGDIAFFDNDEGQIIHVGILLNNHEIIHASGWVKIESIDHQGIFNAEQQKYSHKLRVIKRII